MMKRLTSILLALLMLVGMALAETSDDTLLGDWYGLWADTPFHLMLAENDEFQMSAGDFSCAGRWWQTEDGDYYLASPDMIGGMLLRETGSGLAFRFKQMEDMEILLARSMDEWTTPLVVRTDMPLEAFQGTWAVESARNGSERILNLEPDEDGMPQMLCTVAGTEITLHPNQENAPDITATATWENGTLRTGTLSGWGEQGEKVIITIFQTEDGGMYATLEISVADMSGTLTLTLVPVE